MRQSESIWGNINTCAEIALNIYMIYAEHGKGVMVVDAENSNLTEETLEKGVKDENGNVYFDETTAEIPLKEVLNEKLENGEITESDISSFFEDEEDFYGEQIFGINFNFDR